MNQLSQEIPIVTIRNSTQHNCWCFVRDGVESPIRRGLYSANVPKATVMREVANTAIIEQGGPVKVQISE